MNVFRPVYTPGTLDLSIRRKGLFNQVPHLLFVRSMAFYSLHNEAVSGTPRLLSQ